MPDLAPDTQQNLLYAVYFTITHNLEAVIYFGCMCLAILIALIKPTRAMILIMLGFGLLLFGFQYNKHILIPLKQQTESALITERQSHRTQRAIDLTLARVLPLAFPLAGWSSIVFGFLIGVLFEWRGRDKDTENPSYQSFGHQQPNNTSHQTKLKKTSHPHNSHR